MMNFNTHLHNNYIDMALAVVTERTVDVKKARLLFGFFETQPRPQWLAAPVVDTLLNTELFNETPRLLVYMLDDGTFAVNAYSLEDGENPHNGIHIIPDAETLLEDLAPLPLYELVEDDILETIGKARRPMFSPREWFVDVPRIRRFMASRSTKLLGITSTMLPLNGFLSISRDWGFYRQNTEPPGQDGGFGGMHEIGEMRGYAKALIARIRNLVQAVFSQKGREVRS